MLKAGGRVVMVSGASRGIGRAVVEHLLDVGFTVSAGLRQPAQLAERERLSVHRYEADEIGSAEAWVGATVARWSRIDALVNTAGIHHMVRVGDVGEDELDEMWRVNVKGPLRVTRAALPHLSACGHGRVVNLASLSGKRVSTNVGYAMSKFALVALTHGIRREFRDAGVRATAICPGLVATDMAKVFSLPPTEMTQPSDLAELIELVLCTPNNASISELLVHCQYEPML